MYCKKRYSNTSVVKELSFVLFALHQIADLGLATSQTWSKLTKEESRRKTHQGKRSCARAAGTLCYMAPEHLKSINNRSTEKSDVYSFAIVVWVVLTGREPYESESRFTTARVTIPPGRLSYKTTQS